MANYLEQLDAQLASLLSEWSVTTTLLAILIAAFVAYPIFYSEEPDTHPLLLARQSSAAPIRNKNESAAYRSPEVPYGTPLKAGLNVKDANAPRWAPGKNGDLRDVWREVLRGGSTGDDGKEIPEGAIMTVFGKEQVVEHDLKQLSAQIVTIGQRIKETGAKKVAIYLPNSIEYLLTIFACSFYGATPILLPYNQPHPKVYDLINATGADALVAAAGNLPLDDLASKCKALRLLTWVVEATSQHMDWNGVPDSAAAYLKVSVWHDLIAESKGTMSGDLPTNESGDAPADLVAVWQATDQQQKPEIVSFTQGNMTSAIAASISALPLRQRFTGSDLVLPADSFTHTYVLCQTFAALFCHASLAITSVTGPGVELAAASRGISPTIIICSPESLLALHAKMTQNPASMPQILGKYNQSQALSAGRMPVSDALFGFLAPPKSAVGNKPGKLRLIMTAHRIGGGSPALASTILSDLRIFTRARICYALTAPRVAGAVAQSNVFDYRVGADHFGTPLSSLEVRLASTSDDEVSGTRPVGELIVSGPSVSGKEVRLGVQAKIHGDGTLGLPQT